MAKERRSERTVRPARSSGRSRVVTCMTRSASKRKSSASGASGRAGSRRISRSRAPAGVPPGSLVRTAGWERVSSRALSRRAWVDFPEPSIPSKTIRHPGRHPGEGTEEREDDGVFSGECAEKEGVMDNPDLSQGLREGRKGERERGPSPPQRTTEEDGSRPQGRGTEAWRQKERPVSGRAHLPKTGRFPSGSRPASPRTGHDRGIWKGS